MRQFEYRSLAYVLVISIGLAALSASGRGCVEYENRNGNRSFSLNTARTGYTTLHTRSLKYSTASGPGFTFYRWSYPGENFFDLQISHWLLALPIAVAIGFNLKGCWARRTVA
jgi:hypothetical protein